VIATAVEASVASLTVAILDTGKDRTASSTDGDATVTMGGWGFNPFGTEAKIY